MKNFVFALTHGFTSRVEGKTIKTNPSHTDEGLFKLISFTPILALLDITDIWSGDADRFFQTALLARGVIGSRVKIKLSYFLGGVYSRVKIGDQMQIASAIREILPLCEYEGISSSHGAFDGWMYLANLQGCTTGTLLICTGREFLETIGLKSRSESLYEIDVQLKKIRPIIVKGRQVGEPPCATYTGNKI